MGKRAPAQQTTQTVEPWAEAKPFLTYGMQQARNLYDNNGGFNYYPGQTVVGFDPATQASLDRTQQRAMSGSPVTRNAQGLIDRTVQGQFLNANPYLDGAIDTASRGLVRNFNQAVVPGLNASFSRAGRYGSGAQASAFGAASSDLATQLGDISGRMAYQNFGDERSRMQQAAAMAPQLAAQDYVDLAQLGQVGAAREEQAQRELNDRISRWDNQNNKERQALDEYLQRIGMSSNGFQTSVTTQPGVRQNRLAGAIGGGLGAAGLAGQLGLMSSPWGWGLMAAGALGGAL